jgi:hypothetical protein
MRLRPARGGAVARDQESVRVDCAFTLGPLQLEVGDSQMDGEMALVEDMVTKCRRSGLLPHGSGAAT